jgi:surface polysaccharide O-acyltransferase-like enzyme
MADEKDAKLEKSRAPGARLAALDALRGAAMFLGVCLHASVSYMTGRFPGPLWGTQEKPGSSAFDYLFWLIHGFRLPLFFLIAGLFAVVVYEARGFSGFLLHRSQRLLVPYLVGCAIILPICLYIWSFGWLVTGRCTVKDILRVRFVPELQADVFGPMHLWFLADLFIISMIFAALRRLWARSTVLVRFPQSTSFGYGLASPFILSIPSAVLLFINPNPVFAFHNSFIPSPARLAYYGYFFYVGVRLAPFRDKFTMVTRRWYLQLILAGVSGALIIAFLRLDSWSIPGTATRLGLAAATALFAWTSIFGWLGVFLRSFRQSGEWIRYLADASYWIYLVHLPLVGLVQLTFFGVPMAIEIKFLLVTSFASGIGLLSYATLVRYSRVGTCLNGRRRRPCLGADKLSGQRIAA